MKEVNEAYRVLGDENLRKRYDLSLETGAPMMEDRTCQYNFF
jgi:curved DNA-binding protein CbpA